MAKNKYNRTPESEMRIGALRIAKSKPGGTVTTSDIKSEIHLYVNLTPEDFVLSKKRTGESMYLQIVGNLVSHKKNSYSIFNKGYAVRTEDGFTITPAGLEKLTSMGF